MKQVLNAIFFDVDETLYATADFTTQARLEAVKAMVALGLQISVEDCYRELQELISEFGSNYGQHYNKLLQRLPAACSKGVNSAILVAGAVKAYHDCKRRALKVYPDVVDFLRDFQERGVTLGVITHGLEIKQAEKLLRLDVYRYLSPGAILITDQIGISKPNPKLYLRACRQAAVRPREAMYVGDHPRHDVDAANEAGMVTVRVRRGGRYVSQEGETAPCYEIRTFTELDAILESDFRLPGA